MTGSTPAQIGIESTVSGTRSSLPDGMGATGIPCLGFLDPDSLPLLAVLSVAAVGSAILLGLALAAFVRRQSRPYLLIVGAFAALLGRSAVAGFTVLGTLSPTSHHVLEHCLDVVLVALVIAAVYHARTISQEVESKP